MKLYNTQGGDEQTLLVRLVAKLMQTEDLQSVKVGADDAALKRKSLTGRFPVLEDESGAIVCDSLPIARYLSRDNAQFTHGADASQKA